MYLECDSRHFFHRDCGTEWIKIKSTCPLCRQDFREKILSAGGIRGSHLRNVSNSDFNAQNSMIVNPSSPPPPLRVGGHNRRQTAIPDPRTQRIIQVINLRDHIEVIHDEFDEERLNIEANPLVVIHSAANPPRQIRDSRRSDAEVQPVTILHVL